MGLTPEQHAEYTRRYVEARYPADETTKRYDDGGALPAQSGGAVNDTGSVIRVLTLEQWRMIQGAD